MDAERVKLIQDLDNQSSRIFLDFMTRTAKYEELVKLGQQFLVGFHQELEIFRRSPQNKKSDKVDVILESTKTESMKTNWIEAYIEHGRKLPFLDSENVKKLYSCQQRLQEHLEQVSVLLDELECLREDVIGIARQVNQGALDLLEVSLEDGRAQPQLFSEEEEKEPVLEEKAICHASIIAALIGMMKLDFVMQEKIILALNLKTPSSQLESFCQMWDLRPYIDHDIMRQAWKLVP